VNKTLAFSANVFLIGKIMVKHTFNLLIRNDKCRCWTSLHFDIKTMYKNSQTL